MGNISESIRKIYGITGKKHKDFIKKYSLEDVTMDVKTIKSWDTVPEKVLNAFEKEFGANFNLLHRYFKHDLSMKDLTETLDEMSSVSPNLAVDEVISMLISFTEEDIVYDLSKEDTNNMILSKENTTITVKEVIDIFNVYYYNDMRMNAMCYSMFGTKIDEEITVDAELTPNFITMLRQLTDGGFDISEGNVTFIASADSDNESCKIIPSYNFTVDENIDTITFQGAESFLFLEQPDAVAQNFQIIIKVKSSIKTKEVADGLDSTKEVPVEYMGSWSYMSGQFAGLGSEFTAIYDATDFDNECELKVVEEQIKYIETAPFFEDGFMDQSPDEDDEYS